MPIRPIDMQVAIPRTSEVSSRQQGQMNRGELQQHQFANQMQKNIIKNQQQVQSSNKPEYSINKDGNNKNKYEQNRDKKQKDKNKKEKNQNLLKDRNSTIDIRI